MPLSCVIFYRDKCLENSLLYIVFIWDSDINRYFELIKLTDRNNCILSKINKCFALCTTLQFSRQHVSADCYTQFLISAAYSILIFHFYPNKSPIINIVSIVSRCVAVLHHWQAVFDKEVLFNCYSSVSVLFN